MVVARTPTEVYIVRQSADFGSRTALDTISDSHKGAMQARQMKLFIYIPTEEIRESPLVELIETKTPGFQIELFRSIKDFETRLKKLRYESSIAIIFAPDRQDISDVISLEHCLRDVQIVLIISHENHGTILKAHCLRPRFISYFSFPSKEIETGEITSVLQNMYERRVFLDYHIRECPII
jgi:hypothetical protein